MTAMPPVTTEVAEWMRTWNERNPEKAKKFERLKKMPQRGIGGRFVKRGG
ncbi:hypothetical protein QEH45_gp58 [Microbacterium phage Shocker]|uniref:Uncharacterized protein n=1 Tax=Microbacterium phage Shocker TaxID=2805839 RepID=A0A890UT55_9CAUD|nr:hypothetical protein QEH45_gp58 [Microbacterium phage Shocker]QRI45112.1 hypothetical protein SEA_SHOCKER_58 [Microbacterium phage Shocker]